MSHRSDGQGVCTPGTTSTFLKSVTIMRTPRYHRPSSTERKNKRLYAANASKRFQNSSKGRFPKSHPIPISNTKADLCPAG